MKIEDVDDKVLINEVWRRWRPDIDPANVKFGVHVSESKEIYILTLDDAQGPHIIPMSWEAAVFIAVNLRISAIQLIYETEGLSFDDSLKKVSDYEHDLISRKTGAQE